MHIIKQTSTKGKNGACLPCCTDEQSSVKNLSRVSSSYNYESGDDNNNVLKEFRLQLTIIFFIDYLFFL